MEELTLLVGGAAGLGSRKAGLLLGKILREWGWWVFIYDDYQSLIRGGHNFSLIRAGEKKVSATDTSLDILLALDGETIRLHQSELKPEGFLVYDSAVDFSVEKGLGLPLEHWVKQVRGIPLMKNVALVGAVGKILGISWETVEKVIRDEFGKESEKLNIAAAHNAFGSTKTLLKIPKLKTEEYSLLTGNEGIGLGMMKAGLEVYFSYPMTPATGILHFLANKKNLKVYQLENEIAVINVALGASYAGSRVAVGTSGGGFALMAEGLSFAAQAEIPLLIIESQRIGPSTGVPTYTSQSDLNFVLGAGHGDFLRFVIAPSDGEEAAFWAGEALNLAWEFQTPVILLVDKQISESTFSVEEKIWKKIKIRPPKLVKNQENYFRYLDTDSGISPLAFPGEKGITVKVTGYEHNEEGLTVEEAKLVKKMQEKRLKKYQAMEAMVEKLPAVNVGGNKKAKTALISWGSTTPVALQIAEFRGIRLVQPVILQPFPKKQIEKALIGAERVFVVENNALGQLGEILPKYGIKIRKKILKYDGRPFWPKELNEKFSHLSD